MGRFLFLLVRAGQAAALTSKKREKPPQGESGVKKARKKGTEEKSAKESKGVASPQKKLYNEEKEARENGHHRSGPGCMSGR